MKLFSTSRQAKAENTFRGSNCFFGMKLKHLKSVFMETSLIASRVLTSLTISLIAKLLFAKLLFRWKRRIQTINPKWTSNIPHTSKNLVLQL